MADPQPSKRNRLACLVQIAISVTILAVLSIHLDTTGFAQVFSDLEWTSLIGAILLLLPGLAIRAYRWRLLFQDAHHVIRFGDALWLLFVGTALNLILPASSGDVLKSYYGYRWSGVKERMLSISLADKVIAFGSVGLLGVGAAFLQARPLYALFAFAVVAPAALVLALPQLTGTSPLWIRLLGQGTRLVRGKLDFVSLMRHVHLPPRTLIAAVALSVLGWTVTYLQLYLCFHAAGASVPLAYVYTVAPLITLVRLFPLTFGGVGSDEAAIYYFFHAIGVNFETVLAAALLYRSVVLILPGIIGLGPLALKQRLAVSNNPTSNATRYASTANFSTLPESAQTKDGQNSPKDVLS